MLNFFNIILKQFQLEKELHSKISIPHHKNHKNIERYRLNIEELNLESINNFERYTNSYIEDYDTTIQIHLIKQKWKPLLTSGVYSVHRLNPEGIWRIEKSVVETLRFNSFKG